MKKAKFIYIILVGIMALPFISGCKKGDQDPFLSLRSRDGRLIKEWKLVKVEGTEISKDSYISPTITTIYSFDGTTFQCTETTTINSTPTITKTTGLYTLEIKEDGTLSINETITTSGISSTTTALTSKGTWVWATGNKKKDHLLLSFNLSYINRNYFDGGLVYVSRLSSNELVLNSSSAESNATGVSSSSNSSDFTYTFEKK